MTDGKWKREREKLTDSWLDDIKKYNGTSMSNTQDCRRSHSLEDSHVDHTGARHVVKESVFINSMASSHSDV